MKVNNFQYILGCVTFIRDSNTTVYEQWLDTAARR
jgi:hypothetical protein